MEQQSPYSSQMFSSYISTFKQFFKNIFVGCSDTLRLIKPGFTAEGGRLKLDLAQSKKGACKERCLQDKACLGYNVFEYFEGGLESQCRHFYTYVPEVFYMELNKKGTGNFYKIERCLDSK